MWYINSYGLAGMIISCIFIELVDIKNDFGCFFFKD